jgi:hypothetical protein
MLSQGWVGSPGLRCALLLCTMLAQACTSFDPLDQRGETVNRNANDYANDATLLNVVRAKLSEPLAFVTITGLAGTQSATGSLGFTGFTFGPHVHTSPRAFTLGPNSVGRTNSNTVNISVIDDPASFAALLAPMNPAMLAFFINQDYPRDLLFFLFVDEIREMEVDSKGRETGIVLHAYVNKPIGRNPPPDSTFGPFITTMANLLSQGLTARIDITDIPTGKSITPSQLCIDRFAPKPHFGAFLAAQLKSQPVGKNPALCENAPWVQAQAVPSAGGSGGDTASSPAKSSKPEAKSQLAATAKHLVAYPVIDQEGHHYHLYMRSTYGIYNYLGTLLSQQTDIDNFQIPDASGYGGIRNLQTGKTGDCFAEVEYRDVDYCIPNNASNTKRLFSLLHQLQQIQTAPSNAPTTLTVTTVP